MRNYFNEIYAKDSSKKVRVVKKAQAERAEQLLLSKDRILAQGAGHNKAVWLVRHHGHRNSRQQDLPRSYGGTALHDDVLQEQEAYPAPRIGVDFGGEYP